MALCRIRVTTALPAYGKLYPKAVQSLCRDWESLFNTSAGLTLAHNLPHETLRGFL
jgi:hypothetical protein